MPWSHPAPRMREFISAMRAIWDCWNDGTKLDFRGDFYTHTLMTPFFNPGPNPYGPPKVYPGRRRRDDDRGRRRGVRRLPLPRLHHRALPPRGHAARAGAGPGEGGQDARRLRDRRSVLRRHRHQRGGDGRGRRRARAADRASTARRRPTAACSSCTAGASCRTSSTRCPSRASGTRWASSSTTTSSTPSPSSPSPSRSAPELLKRYGDCVTRISFYAPYKSDPDRWRGVMEALQAG